MTNAFGERGCQSCSTPRASIPSAGPQSLQCAVRRELLRTLRQPGGLYALGSGAALIEEPASARDRSALAEAAPSQHGDQPIDRDHEDAVLDPLDATRANEADHRHGAAPTPPPTPARQPRRLFPHPGEMAIVVAPRLGLDGEHNSGGRDRQGVDVPPASPRQRVPQPPPVGLERPQRATDLVLRASADARRARDPVPNVPMDICGARGWMARRPSTL